MTNIRRGGSRTNAPASSLRFVWARTRRRPCPVDDGDRLTGIDHALDTTSLAFVEYTLDNVGNRVQRVDGLGTHTYAYDDVYRLTAVTFPGPSTTTYAYDAFGNRTSMTVGTDTTNYAYDDADRLTNLTPPGSSAVVYDWDDSGNLVERGSDTFIWDFENRLLEVAVGSTTTEFSYRGDGLRDSRTVGMNTTTFTWDIATGIPVVIDDGDFHYVYGAHGLIAQKTATDDYYLLSDGLGSTMAITDDQGAVVRDYQYDVFGGVVGGSGTVESEFQFAGEQVDDSTGLQYLRNRYSDMETGASSRGTRCRRCRGGSNVVELNPCWLFCCLLPHSTGLLAGAPASNSVVRKMTTGSSPSLREEWTRPGSSTSASPACISTVEPSPATSSRSLGVPAFRVMTTSADWMLYVSVPDAM